MSNYHVTNKKGSDDWRVIKQGSGRVSAIADTQREAEKIAKQLSFNSGGGEVAIHKPNGGPIRDKDTVVPGRESSVIDKKH